MLRAVPHEGTWRPDIDGLRALAVLAVVGYHYFPAAIQGGFVGVDIFFVISGYLITQILVARLAEEKFSVGNFYLRRIRRIFPALAVVLGALLAFGWFWLQDDEYAHLGGHTAAGAGFVSNLLLWRESGYFDASTESKPLAHLWSLGVEEQFYFLWPLLLWALWGRTLMLQVLGLLLLLSLTAGAWMLQHDQATAFYLPFFRFWELVTGGLLAIAVRRGLAAGWLQQHRDSLSLAGLLLLAASVLTIHSGAAFPGVWALMPVGGTTLLIAAGPQALCNRSLLSHRALVWIGLVSFPLYLWHWPLLVMARTVFNAEPKPEGMLILLALSMVLAVLTYRWIEVPIRTSLHLRRDAAVLAGAVLAVGLAGWLISHQKGVPGRTSQPVAVRLERHIPMSRFAVDDCRISEPTARSLVLRCTRDERNVERFALIGDSKADVLFNGLVRTSSAQGRWLFIGGSLPKSQTVPVISADSQYRSYQAAAWLALNTVATNESIDTVVLVAATRALFRLRREDTLEDLPQSANYAPARDGLRRFVGELLAAGKRVVLVVDNPTLPDPLKCLSRARFALPQPLGRWFGAEEAPSGCRLSLRRHLELSEPYRRLLVDVQQIDPARVSVFDTLQYLCDEGKDLCGPVEKDRVLYSFTDHISDYAAGKIGAALNLFLQEQGAGARAKP